MIKRAIAFLNNIDKNVFNVNVQDVFGRTPLFVAAKAGHVECVKILLGAGADKTIKAKTKKLDVVVVGLDERAEIDRWSKSKTFPKLEPTAGVLFSLEEMKLTLKKKNGWIGQVMVPDMAVNVVQKGMEIERNVENQNEFTFSIDVECDNCAAVVMVGWVPSTS